MPGPADHQQEKPEPPKLASGCGREALPNAINYKLIINAINFKLIINYINLHRRTRFSASQANVYAGIWETINVTFLCACLKQERILKGQVAVVCRCLKINPHSADARIPEAEKLSIICLSQLLLSSLWTENIDQEGVSRLLEHFSSMTGPPALAPSLGH